MWPLRGFWQCGQSSYVFYPTLVLSSPVFLTFLALQDGHIDLPLVYRFTAANNISAINLREPAFGHLDIPRLREGRVGGFWWSAWVPCPPDDGMGNGGDQKGNGTLGDFIEPQWRVRDTLEQIDVAHLAIEQYPDTFEFVTTAEAAKLAMREGKVASFIGVEGCANYFFIKCCPVRLQYAYSSSRHSAHQLGNSLAVLRQYVRLGVRYVTLTHTCHNAFADSAGLFTPLPPRHFGLSELGEELIRETNRLGIVVDLSHTSDLTAVQALAVSQAPVIWSHSNAREVWDLPR